MSRLKKGKVMTIEKMYALQEDLAISLSTKYGRKITREEVFEALYIRLSDDYNLEWQGDLWDISINYDRALQYLSDFDFEVIKNKIVSEEEILPDEFLVKRKVQIKSKGLVWVIHKYDKDPFPSNPHAHHLDSNIKLDLSNGKLYKIKKYVDTIPKKALLDIREKASRVLSIDLPKIEI